MNTLMVYATLVILTRTVHASDAFTTICPHRADSSRQDDKNIRTRKAKCCYSPFTNLLKK